MDLRLSTAVASGLGRHYEFMAELPGGNMATVYKARDRIMGRLVAIKIMRREGTKWAAASLYREATLASRLKHPNVVTVFTADDIGEYTYLIMEFLAGGSLADRIRVRGALPPAEAVRWLLPILDGLGHAHDRGICHLDVKSSNVMFGDSGQPVLTDFGSAKSGADSDADSAGPSPSPIVCTPHYASPEQLSGHETDARSDIFSLGVLLYEMLTGRLPFQDVDLKEIRSRVLSEFPPPPSRLNPRVPDALSQVAMKAMARRSDDRFRSCDEMALALQPFADSKPFSQRTESPEISVPDDEVSEQEQDVVPQETVSIRLPQWSQFVDDSEVETSDTTRSSTPVPGEGGGRQLENDAEQADRGVSDGDDRSDFGHEPPADSAGSSPGTDTSGETDVPGERETGGAKIVDVRRRDDGSAGGGASPDKKGGNTVRAQILRPLLFHLLFGTGMIFVDRKCVRGWVYPVLVGCLVVLVVLILTEDPAVDGGTFWVPVAVLALIAYLLSFADVARSASARSET